MIYKIYSDNENFRSIKFQKNFNVILAERSKTSSEKDSRNGVGKSSLIEVIHFCMGANWEKNKSLGNEKFKDWTFSMEFDLLDKKITCHRKISDDKKIFIEGVLPDIFEKKIHEYESKRYYDLEDWKLILGNAFFKLKLEKNSNLKYTPSFRSLISYFIRKEYSIPFEYFRKQPSWQTQIYNAYLLKLSWEYAHEWKMLSDENKEIKELKKMLTTPTFSSLFGVLKLGELEASKNIKEDELKKEKIAIDSFKVHESYKDTEKQSTEITKKIHALSNKNISDRKMLSFYKSTLNEEELDPEYADIIKMYEEAQCIIPDSIKKKVHDVKDFHASIIKNRKSYLSNEIIHIESNIIQRENQIKDFSDERSEKMTILQTHGALQEFQKLSEIYNKKQVEVKDIKERIRLLKKLKESTNNFKIKKEDLKKRALVDYNCSSEIRKKSISLFNENSKYLYDSSGNLIIDISDNGFTFDIKIDRSDSSGISLMKIFCYDLMLANMWSTKEHNPIILIHDSGIFSDVDERQIQKAVEKAQSDSEKHNFQYICFLNSDKLPPNLNNDNFKQHVRLTLKDVPPEERLFGFHF